MYERRLSPEGVWQLVQTEFPLLARLWRRQYVIREADRDYGHELEATWPRHLANNPNDTTRGYLTRVETLLHAISTVDGFSRLGAGLRSTIDQGIATVHHITTAAWLRSESKLLAVEKSMPNGSAIDCVVEVDGQVVNVECFAPNHRPSTRINLHIGVPELATWMEHADVEYMPRVSRIREKSERQLPSDVPGIISIRPTGALEHDWIEFALDGMNPRPNVLGALLWMRTPLTGIEHLPRFDDAYPHWIRNPGAAELGSFMPWEC